MAMNNENKGSKTKTSEYKKISNGKYNRKEA